MGTWHSTCKVPGVYQVLGALVDAVHALLMIAWVAALPLLFVRRWPRLRRTIAIYALAFIVLNQGSRLVLGECFLTTVARWFWDKGTPGAAPGDPAEWFTVRFAKAVFHMTPSHRSIVLLSEVLGFVTAGGALLSHARARKEPLAASTSLR